MRRILLIALIVAAYAPTAVAHSACAGDCDGNRMTSAGEIEIAMRLLFKPQDLLECIAADVDASGGVTAGDLVGIVRARLMPTAACGATATPAGSVTILAASPTPTATPLKVSEWIPLAPLPAGPRQEVGAAGLAGSIYVLGGFDARGRGSDRVERYDVADDRWTAVAPLPRAMHHVGAASLHGGLYCVGGFIGSTFQPSNQALRYAPTDDQWTAIAPLPTARGALALIAIDGNLHAIGGSTFAGSSSSHTLYDPSFNTWRDLAPLPGAGRNHLAATQLDGAIYVVGGRRDGAGLDNSQALDRYDTATDSWTSLASMPTARSGLALAALHGRLFAVGGEVASTPSGVFPQVEVYDPSVDSWTTLDDMPVPRHGLGAVAIGNRIYFPGGAVFAGFGASDRHDALDLGSTE